jgi:hypothetical protein
MSNGIYILIILLDCKNTKIAVIQRDICKVFYDTNSSFHGIVPSVAILSSVQHLSTVKSIPVLNEPKVQECDATKI